MDAWHPDTFGMALASAIGFGVVGLLLVVLGYKLFDWITPKIDVQKELIENRNMAVAIVIAALILGLSWIVGRAIG